MKKTLTEDKILLKELVDKISILGDQKDFNNQVKLLQRMPYQKPELRAKLLWN